jgi:hypothetical protein
MSPNWRWAGVAAARRARCCVLPLLAALAIQGCTTAPQQALTGPDPADPDVRVPATSYRSALRDFHRAPPNEPAPWTGGDATPESKKEKP